MSISFCESYVYPFKIGILPTEFEICTHELKTGRAIHSLHFHVIGDFANHKKIKSVTKSQPIRETVIQILVTADSNATENEEEIILIY